MTASTEVRALALPPACSLHTVYQRTDLADAYQVTLPPHASRNPEILARWIMANEPAWIGALMHVRDLAVVAFGLKTARALKASGGAQRIGPFRVYHIEPAEIIMGEDDSHLDFRLSLLLQPGVSAGQLDLTLSTVVHCHNRLGRFYIAVIAPFHRVVVRAILRRAAARGWPTAIQGE